MVGVTFYTIISVVIVSLVSLIGIFSIFLKLQKSKRFLLVLVSLSAGTLFGGAFLHLLPEAVEEMGFTLELSLVLLGGVIVFFILEKFIHWRHCHHHVKHTKKHDHKHLDVKKSAIAPLNLMGDAMHNLLDGLVIAGSYLVSIPAGIATTIAVVLHEVPQEMADFGVLLYSGYSKRKAIFLNLATGAVAIIGAIIGLTLGKNSETFVNLILPFAAGGFLYIAGSNLIPELHKKCSLRDSFWHLLAMLVGIGIMIALRFLE
jgi:zinc and cadmium transporter